MSSTPLCDRSVLNAAWTRGRPSNPRVAGSNPARLPGAMSRDIVRSCPGTSFTLWVSLVVPGGVEGELSEQFALFGEDADLQVVGEDEDALAGVSSAEADVVEPAVVPQGDHAGVDAGRGGPGSGGR